MFRKLFLSRREFSRSAGAFLTLVWGVPATAKTLKKPNLKRALDPAAWTTLGFLANEIIPKGEKNLSATEADVVEYLKHLLADGPPRFRWLPEKGKKVSPFLPYYGKLVGRLDAIAKEKFQKTYSQLEVSQRSEVTKLFAQTKNSSTAYRVSGSIPVEEMSDADLFALARRHVLEGYLSDPRHRGNKDFQGWKAISNVCNMHYPDPPENCPTHQIYEET